MDDKWLDILMKIIFSVAALFLLAMTVAISVGVYILIRFTLDLF